MSATTAPAGRTTAPLGPWLVPLMAALTAALVFRGSLAYFFTQDDFLGLARARHLAPALTGPWRWVSGQGYFELMRGFGVARALPYHAVSLIAHAGASALLGFVLGRRFAPPAAACGAVFFAAHPAVYTAVYSVSGIGEILAGLGTIAAIAVAARGDAWKWAALPLFALALLSKESVILLPLALLPAPGLLAPLRPTPAGPRSPWNSRAIVIGLGAVSIAIGAVLLATDVFGVKTHLSPAAPYAVSFGPHVLANLGTYLGWTLNVCVLSMSGFEDAVDPGVFPWAVVAVLLWGIGLMTRAPRARGLAAAGLAYLLLLIPVLGLSHHTYHYYLYTPLMAAAWCVAAALDAAMERPAAPAKARGAAPHRARSRAVQWVAWSLAALMAVNGAIVVRKIETFPFSDPRLRSDALVDRALIAERVRDGLAAAAIPAGAPLVFWSPASIRAERIAHPERDPMLAESYWERNVRSALMDGLAIRVLFPATGDVSFVHAYQSAPAPARVVLYDVDGQLKVLPAPTLDSLMAAHPEDRP